MARISTYNLDQGISVDDLLLGSSREGTQNGQPIYATRNYRLSDLAQFFQNYDFSNNISLTEVEGRVTALENAGIDLTAFSVSTNAPGTAALSYDNLTGQFTYTPPDLSSFITSVSVGFSDLTSTPTTIAGYGITDAFDGSYTSLTNVPTSFPPSAHNHDTLYAPLNHNHDTLYAAISHNHDDRYYTETEVDTLLGGYLSTSTNIGDLANVSSATPSTGQVLKWNGSAWAPGTDLQASGGTGISLTDLSVSVASAGTANLSYDNTSGTFTYTPPLLTSYATLTGISVTTANTPSGNGSLTYNNNGGFTFTQPDLSSYISLTSISVGTEAPASGNGGISYNSSSGVFTYTPPDFSGSYLPTSGGTLTGNLTIQGILSVTGSGTSNFSDNVSVGGNLSVTGAFTVNTVVGDLRGDVYSIVGSTSSVKVLESGSGSTPDAYFIGDLRNSQTDQVFDTSTATFRKDVSIGLSTTSTNNLNMHGASKIWFDEGISVQEQYIDKVKVSQWDASVLTSSKFQMGQTTGTPQEDLIQFNINGASGLTSYLSIKPGTYISASTDTDNHVLLDVNNTNLASLYVGRIGGQIMEGPLSITAGNLSVSGNGTFIEGDGKIDVYDTSTTPVKILDHINGWFKGNIRGGDLQDVDGNNIFDSSTSTFANSLTIEGESITLGANPTSLSASDISSIKAGAVQNIKFEKVANTGAPNDIKIVIDNLTNTDLDSQTVIKGSTYISITDDGGTPANPIISAYINSNPSNGDLGLATVSYVNTKFASDATAIGWNIDGTVTTPDSVNIVLYAEDGLSFVYTPDDTNNPNGYDDFSIRNSKGVESFAIDDNTGVLTITKTSAGGSPGTLTANLQNYVDGRVSATTTLTLEDITNNGASSDSEIKIIGNQNTNGMLLARRNDTTGIKLISTFDTFSEQGYIRVGSQISGSQDYGYIGHNSNGLHLSKISETGSAIVIDSSDDVSMGGDLSVSGTLTATGAANLDGGIAVDTNFSVDGTNGNVSTSGTLSSGNTAITGTLGVTSTCDFQNAVTANSLTVTNNSSLNTVSLSGDVTPSTDSARSIGTTGLKLLNVFTDNLNGVAPGSFANKDTATNQEFDATLVAPDFQLTSDERLKENIIDLKPRKINVDFKEYNFKDKKQTRFGVVAQELEKHHPEFIKETELGYKSVSYIDLLVAKIVELEDRIKQLENA